MSTLSGRGLILTRLLFWTARIAAIAAIIPLMLMVFGESGSGPSGAREWVYLALFPFGFSAGYLLGWRWPLVGGCISLACMALSLIVIGRTYNAGAYLVWGAFCVPGILYVIVGLMLRSAADDSANNEREQVPASPPRS